MNYFEEQFSEYDSTKGSLPDGYSWEEMADGIYKKMEPKRKNRLPLWWILLPLLGSSFLWFNQENKTTNNIKQPLSTTDNNNTYGHVEVAYASILPKRKYTQEFNKFPETFWEHTPNTFNSFGTVENRKAVYAGTSSLIITTVPLLPAKNEFSPFELNEQLLLPQLKQLNTKLNPEESPFQSQGSISLFSGLNLLQQGVSTNPNSPFLSVFPSWNIGVEAAYSWSKDHSISFGYSLQNWTEEFYFEDEIDFIIDLQNQPISRTVSIFSGNVLQENRGEVAAEAQRYIKERFYNEYQAHQLSLSYDRHWKVASKHTVSIGLSMHTLLRVQGNARRIDETREIVTLADAGGYGNARWLAGAQLNYQYQLFPKFSIWGRLQGQQSLNDWDEFNDTYTYPRLWNAQIGMRWHFIVE